MKTKIQIQNFSKSNFLSEITGWLKRKIIRQKFMNQEDCAKLSRCWAIAMNFIVNMQEV